MQQKRVFLLSPGKSALIKDLWFLRFGNFQYVEQLIQGQSEQPFSTWAQHVDSDSAYTAGLILLDFCVTSLRDDYPPDFHSAERKSLRHKPSILLSRVPYLFVMFKSGQFPGLKW